jgi:hypothetical protein
MGCCLSRTRTALVGSALEIGEADPPPEANPTRASSRRVSEATPGTVANLLLGPLGGLSPRADVETEPAREAEHVANALTSALDMPPEIIESIAAQAPPEDINALADTCRTLRHILADEKRSITLSVRAQHVDTPAEARELLHDVQTGISRTILRISPLTALATRIAPRDIMQELNGLRMNVSRPSLMRRWRDYDRDDVFNSLWTAITQLPPTDQASPLTALAPTLRHPPGVERRSYWFEAFLDQITHLPLQDRAMPLAALAPQIRYLHVSRQGAMYDGILEQVRQIPTTLRSRPLEALAPNIAYVPQQAARYSALLEEIRQLPMQCQGATLTRLAAFNRAVPTHEQPAAFEHTMQVIEQLAPEQRGMPLRAFTRQIQLLDEAVRTAVFDRVFGMTGHLATVDDRAGLLTELAGQIEELPGRVQTARFHDLYIAIEQLPPEHQIEPETALRNVRGLGRLLDMAR